MPNHISLNPTIMMTKIDSLIVSTWTVLNPAFVPTADYLIRWPIIYAALIVINLIVKKKVREGAYKILQILIGWISILAIVIASVSE